MNKQQISKQCLGWSFSIQHITYYLAESCGQQIKWCVVTLEVKVNQPRPLLDVAKSHLKHPDILGYLKKMVPIS